MDGGVQRAGTNGLSRCFAPSDRSRSLGLFPFRLATLAPKGLDSPRSREPASQVEVRKPNTELEMRRRGLLSLTTLALLLGVLLTALGAAKLQHEVSLNANGLRTPGKFVDSVTLGGRDFGTSAVFEVVPAAGSPFRVRVGSASPLRDWDKRTTLNLICSELRPQAERCEVDTFADRWLEPMLLLVVGLPALAWGALGIRGRAAGAGRT
jgi:hypothetical protein